MRRVKRVFCDVLFYLALLFIGVCFCLGLNVITFLLGGVVGSFWAMCLVCFCLVSVVLILFNFFDL